MQIQIRIADQVVCEIELEQDTSLHRGLALKWSHVLGNRQRWKHRCKNKEQVHEKACAALETLGVTADHLETIGNAKVIEIRFPDATEDELWACEAFPWEHWISAATGNTSIVVVRHMAVDRKATTRKPKTFALVESSPGEFQGVKNFATEREFVGFGLRSLSESDISNDPTEEELAKQIAAAEPDVIHFTAVDNSLGRQLDWGYATEEMKFYKSIYNGACFKTTRKLQKSDLKHLEEVVWPRQEKAGTEVEKEVDRRRISVHREVNARNVAEYLNAAKTKPLLISLNNWYSNSRTASRCIAEGAGAVLCFHNSIDESIARRFYCEFYYRWASLDFDILAAYAIAIEKIRPMTDHVNGEAVVLWTAESLVERKPESANANPAATPKVFPDPSVDRIQDLVGVNVRPPKYINYSMLHNGRSLLEKLELWFRFPDRAAEQAPNCIRGIDVEVSLQVGPDSFPFEAQVELGIDNPEVDLAAESIFKDGNESRGGISVPLISKLARNLGEAVQTTILVQVKWNGQTLYRQTHAVTLSPANAWRLDDRDTCWIPSFVQPRAPAVSEEISALPGRRSSRKL